MGHLFLSRILMGISLRSHLILVVLCAMVFFPFVIWGQTTSPTTESQGSQVKPAGPTGVDYGMPERLGRQVAPTPSAPWRSPDLSSYTSVLKSAERSPIDPNKRYELVELIDLAERT